MQYLPPCVEYIHRQIYNMYLAEHLNLKPLKMEAPYIEIIFIAVYIWGHFDMFCFKFDNKNIIQETKLLSWARQEQEEEKAALFLSTFTLVSFTSNIFTLVFLNLDSVSLEEERAVLFWSFFYPSSPRFQLLPNFYFKYTLVTNSDFPDHVLPFMFTDGTCSLTTTDRIRSSQNRAKDKLCNFYHFSPRLLQHRLDESKFSVQGWNLAKFWKIWSFAGICGWGEGEEKEKVRRRRR